jgi:hypothetical protein
VIAGLGCLGESSVPEDCMNKRQRKNAETKQRAELGRIEAVLADQSLAIREKWDSARITRRERRVLNARVGGE